MKEARGLIKTNPVITQISKKGVILVVTSWSMVTMAMPDAIITRTTMYCSTSMVVLGSILSFSFRVIRKKPTIRISNIR